MKSVILILTAFISELKAGEGEFATYMACDTTAYRKLLEPARAV